MDQLNTILSSIAEGFKIIGQYLWIFLQVVWEGLCLIFEWCGNKIAIWLNTLNPTMFPTTSRIFQYNAISGTILALISIYIVSINILAFSMFMSDKNNSKKHPKQRIRERSLLSVCFWGGALGGFVGMHLFHHKTLHKNFTIGITVMLIIQVLVFSFVAGFFGFWIYLS